MFYFNTSLLSLLIKDMYPFRSTVPSRVRRSRILIVICKLLRLKALRFPPIFTLSGSKALSPSSLAEALSQDGGYRPRT